MIEHNEFINQLILTFTSKLRVKDWGWVKGKYSHWKRERDTHTQTETERDRDRDTEIETESKK